MITATFFVPNHCKAFPQRLYQVSQSTSIVLLVLLPTFSDEPRPATGASLRANRIHVSPGKANLRRRSEMK
jgi:hypothetical protein